MPPECMMKTHPASLGRAEGAESEPVTSWSWAQHHQLLNGSISLAPCPPTKRDRQQESERDTHTHTHTHFTPGRTEKERDQEAIILSLFPLFLSLSPSLSLSFSLFCLFFRRKKEKKDKKQLPESETRCIFVQRASCPGVCLGRSPHTAGSELGAPGGSLLSAA